MLLPLGCKLRPSDEELISGFLRKHVAGEPLEAPLNELVVVDSDNQLGRSEPWVLWAGFQWHHLTEQHLYLFSKLKTTSAKSGKVNRKIEPAGGTWRGSHSVDVNDENGSCIGLKRFMRYEKKGCDESGKWLLEEYSVPEAPLSVLCRLKKSPKGCGGGGVGIKRKTTCCSDEQEQLNLQNKKKMPSSKNKKARHQELNLETDDTICSHDDGVMVEDQESRPQSPNNVPAGPPQVIEETWSHHINNSPVQFDGQDYTISNMAEYLTTGEYEYGGGGGVSYSYGGFQASTSTNLEDCIIPPPQSSTPQIGSSCEPEEPLCDYFDQFLGTSAEAEPSSYYPAIGGGADEGGFEVSTLTTLGEYGCIPPPEDEDSSWQDLLNELIQD